MIIVAEKFASRRNIDFMLYEVFKVEELTRHEFFQDHSRGTFDLVIDTIWKMAAEMMYPNFADMDKKPPQYLNGQAKVDPSVGEFLAACGEGGWINPIWPYEDGGQQLPYTVDIVKQVIMAAANCGLLPYLTLNYGASNLIRAFGSQELKNTYIENITGGKWQGTMALTEPDAGSSLADIRMSAEYTGMGWYKMKGQKIFITNGDTDAVENTIHLVLAKIKGGPAGAKGISLFVVPKYRLTESGSGELNDVSCDGIEHKLGAKGAPACQISFGAENNCRGWLVGQPHEGLAYMFQMINEARINVGTAAAGKTTAAYYASLEYCQQRLQGRKPGHKDPESAQVPIVEHADIRRMLLFQRSVSEGSLALVMQLCKYVDLAKVGVDPEKHNLLVEFLVPIVKTYPSEMGIISTSAAIQCLGGYGFCQDFPLEQYYRDIRIDPIHEGTTGIQGQDILGRKVGMQRGAAYRLFLDEVDQTITEASEIEKLHIQAEELARGRALMEEVTTYLVEYKDQGMLERFTADATLYLEFASLLAIGWQWLIQGIAVCKAIQGGGSEKDINFYRGKLVTMEYFFAYEIPKMDSLARIIKGTKGLTATMDSQWFYEN